MNLYDPTNDTDFEVSQTWPSGNKRTELGKIQRMFYDDLAAIEKEFPRAAEMKDLSKLERAEKVKADPDLARESMESAERIGQAMDRQVIRICQASIDRRTLTPAQLEMVNSDADSDFWLQQNMEVVEDASDRFSKACSRGRRRDIAVAAGAVTEAGTVAGSNGSAHAGTEAGRTAREATEILNSPTGR